MTESRRVMLVLTSLALTSGGGETFTVGLASTLRSAPSIDLVLVLPTGVRTDWTDTETLDRAIWVHSFRGPARMVRDSVMVGRWSRRAKADLVIYPHEWVAWSRHVPTVNVVQNVLHLDPQGRRAAPVKSFLMRTAVRFTAAAATRTISVSPSAQSIWKVITGRDSIVLPEGVASHFAEGSNAARDNLIVIMTGPAAHKRPAIAQTVANNLARMAPASSVVIVGTGPFASASSNVRCLPSVDPRALAQLFHRARVVVLTSTVESFGLPAFEARAAGASTVVCAETPMAEWLSNDPAVHIAKPTPEDLTAATLVAIGLPDTSRRPNGSFTWSSIGIQWVDEIYALASTNGN